MEPQVSKLHVAVSLVIGLIVGLQQANCLSTAMLLRRLHHLACFRKLDRSGIMVEWAYEMLIFHPNRPTDFYIHQASSCHHLAAVVDVLTAAQGLLGQTAGLGISDSCSSAALTQWVLIKVHLKCQMAMLVSCVVCEQHALLPCRLPSCLNDLTYTEGCCSQPCWDALHSLVDSPDVRCDVVACGAGLAAVSITPAGTPFCSCYKPLI